MIHCAWAVMVTPRTTKAAIIRKTRAPTPMVAQVLFAAVSENRERVYAPAGRDPATMKIVALTTNDQPAKKPSTGCSDLATQEYVAPAWTSSLPR